MNEKISMDTLYYSLLWLALVISSCDAYKALVVTMMPSRSHSILNDGIVRQLLKDGNEVSIIQKPILQAHEIPKKPEDNIINVKVTYIRSIEYKNAPPNLRQIDVSSNEEVMPDAAINIKALMDNPVQGNDHKFAMDIMTNVSINTVENKDVRKLLSDPKESFDVVIVEYVDNDLLASLAAVFDCPLIWMSPIEVNSDMLSRIDKMPNPADVPDCMSSNVPPFSFQQRIEELWTRIKSLALQFWYFNDKKIEAYNRLIAPLIAKRGRVPPSLNEIRYNASLVLGYSHVSMGDAFNLPQSYKSVGGYHINEDIEPLPQDLKTIMDNAKNGVIYFSMGSNLKSADWPQETKSKLLEMLGGLKQTVFWKFEDQLSDPPKNVHISKWFPQLSILSHPNCILFITHGGLLSTAEALHFGIPIIGIPGFGDQFINTKRAAKKGFGIEVDMSYNVVEDLKLAVEEVTSNPVYRKKAKEMSFIYHDRPVKPSEELSFWVRHVVETRGAPHLRSPSLHLSLYQRLYIDLIAIILICIILSLVLFRRICTVICSKNKLDDSKKPETKRKKKNN